MSASNSEPIAIIGIGCRFPGGIDTAQDLWRLAAAGRDTVGPVPPERWDAAALGALHDPDEAARAALGCFLEGDVWAWDPAALAVAPAEQPWVDPQFRILAETAWEAVENAGIPLERFRGSSTGVYMGTYGLDNLFRDARPIEDAPQPPYLFGNLPAGAASRTAFALDTRGPVMVISTNCSSGLVALDVACTALTVGDCEMALAGATIVHVSPRLHYDESPLLLSGRGGCFAFDARADGYVRGEGAGTLLLKRLKEAQRDGDRVLAVIRGSVVNNDGQSSRLTAPSAQMQRDLFRRGVEHAQVDPGDVGLVEAHGPGTAVGDPVEYSSIDAVYGRGRGRCALGSIKTNLGHSEPVSGIAGIIKAVECLRRGQVPPNRNFTTWNPSIDRSAPSRLFVPTEVTDWPVAGTTRLAAVCSYGVTGTNAHVILEADPMTSRRPKTGAKQARAAQVAPRLFALTGTCPSSVRAGAERLAGWLEGEGQDVALEDVAHTLAVRRSPLDDRLTVTARTREELTQRLRAYAGQRDEPGTASGTPLLPPAHPGPVFVFTGQGSQRPGMCQGFLDTEPVFTAVVDRLEPLVRAEAGFSLREVITRPERLVGVERIQPTLFAVQVALAEVWASWGVRPAAVIGQSLGEVAAIVVAGGLPEADGVKVICRRAALLATITGGAMASVLLDADAVRRDLAAADADGVVVAVYTGPASTVVSGDAGQIAALVTAWEGRGVTVRMIASTVASHSPQMDPILDPLASALADVATARPAIPFYSTVTPDPRDAGEMDSGYWVHNQRDAVRFLQAVTAALEDGHRLFVECTPHPLAMRPVQDTARARGITDTVAVGSLHQGLDDHDAFLGHLGAAHCAGAAVAFTTHYADGDLAALPTIAWERRRHGGDHIPYRLISPHLVAAHQHPMLGGHVHDPDQPGRHLWQTPISTRTLPWLADHQVAGTPVMPGTGYVEMILAAARQVFDTPQVTATDVRILAPLVLDSEWTLTTHLILAADSATAEVQIRTRTADGATLHAAATVAPHHDTPDFVTDTSGPDWTDRAPEDLYRQLRERHQVFHGPAFTAVDRLRIHPTDDDGTARMHLDRAARTSADTLSIHPALLDQLVHTVVAVRFAHHVTVPGPVVVAGFDEVRLHTAPTAHSRLAVVHLTHNDDLNCVADATLATADGTATVTVTGLRLTNITTQAERFADRLSHIAWRDHPAERTDRPGPPTGHVAVVTHDKNGWTHQVTRALNARTELCHVIATDDAAPLGLPHPCDTVTLVLDAPSERRPRPATAHRNLALAVRTVQALAQLERPPRLWVVTRDDNPLTSEPVRALLRVAAYEHPQLRASFLHAAPRTDGGRLADEILDPRLPVTEMSLTPTARRTAHLTPGGDREAPLVAAPANPVRPDGAYLVTGALGGLGLLTIRRLAEQGAARIVANGRTAPDTRLTAELDDLRHTTKADIRVVTGDIADPVTVEQAIDQATRGGMALRGIIHAAGVVEDATLTTLTPDTVDRCWTGKAQGAWELHLATEGHDLDFFVLYSSVASLIGSPGQGAYAAANGFLDALVTHRRSAGLPATGIHWGPWREVGRGRHLADRGFLTIAPDDGLDALARFLQAGYERTAYSPVDLQRWIDPYPALQTSALLETALGHRTTTAETPLRAELLASDTTGRRSLLEEFLVDSIRDLLGGSGRHVGPHTSMVLLGVDSLGAVQLQQRIQRATGITIPPGVIWIKPTAASIADWLLDNLGDTDDKAPEDQR